VLRGEENGLMSTTGSNQQAGTDYHVLYHRATSSALQSMGILFGCFVVVVVVVVTGV
jgi:hypothetical protein